ncbi:MAG: esterase [Ferruginibacter sp.]|nr:esterase [Ferruginibacter sp.]
MPELQNPTISVYSLELESHFLGRMVRFDCYVPAKLSENVSLLLINDGQDLVTMDFEKILNEAYSRFPLSPLMCIGIYCGADRKNEYGTARYMDYKGRGAKAFLHNRFVLEELLPFIRSHFAMPSFKQKAYAGFSLGGLYAMDIVWNYPAEFTVCGIFSGSMWWRSVSQDEPNFNENEHRIMQKQVREGKYFPWQRYFFEVGVLDETADRNHNGIIDSIDDTQAVINELKLSGCPDKNVSYLELADGRHDVPTWAKAFPTFLVWAFSKNTEQ